MLTSSRSDPSQKGWFWYSDDEDRILTPSELLNTVVASRLYIDKGEPIRFRVDSVEWQDIRPEPPSSNAGPGAQINGDADEQGDVEQAKKDPIEKAGYKVIVSVPTGNGSRSLVLRGRNAGGGGAAGDAGDEVGGWRTDAARGPLRNRDWVSCHGGMVAEVMGSSWRRERKRNDLGMSYWSRRDSILVSILV